MANMTETLSKIEKRAKFYGPKNPFPGASQYDPGMLVTPIEIKSAKRVIAGDNLLITAISVQLVDRALRDGDFDHTAGSAMSLLVDEIDPSYGGAMEAARFASIVTRRLLLSVIDVGDRWQMSGPVTIPNLIERSVSFRGVLLNG